MKEKVAVVKNAVDAENKLCSIINVETAVLNIDKGAANMTLKQKYKCHAIIHSASVLAGGVGAGLAQFPGSDNAILTPIQLAMVVSIGKVFGKSLSESSAKAAVGSAAAYAVGRTASQAMVGWIPGAGNAINATTAAGLTETIGWIIAKEFDEGILF